MRRGRRRYQRRRRLMRQFAASWVWWGLRARSEFSELAFVLEPDRQSKSFVVRRPCKASSGKVSTGRRRTFGILSRDGRSHVNDGDARKDPVAFPVCAATLPSTAASRDCGERNFTPAGWTYPRGWNSTLGRGGRATDENTARRSMSKDVILIASRVLSPRFEQIGGSIRFLWKVRGHVT